MLRVQEVELPRPCVLPSRSPAPPHFLLIRDFRKTIHCYCVCPVTHQNPRACLSTSCPAQPFPSSSTQMLTSRKYLVPDLSTWAGPPSPAASPAPSLSPGLRLNRTDRSSLKQLQAAPPVPVSHGSSHNPMFKPRLLKENVPIPHYSELAPIQHPSGSHHCPSAEKPRSVSGLVWLPPQHKHIVSSSFSTSALCF